MSEVKFPPRITFTKTFNKIELESELFDEFEDKISYISKEEHQTKISQLEERLRVAESKIKEAAWSKQEEIGMRCKQNGHMRDYGKALIEEVRKEREELAAIKEKK